MARIKTIHVRRDDIPDMILDFRYDINVDKEGLFSTTLPKDVVELFEKYQIELSMNRSKNKGYFSSEILEGVVQKVNEACSLFVSRELVSEEIIIRYVIHTQCSYCLDDKGDIVPNGTPFWTNMNTYDWKSGTAKQDAMNKQSFGMLVFAKPLVRKTYKFKTGITRTEYLTLHHAGEEYTKLKEDNYYLRWLDDIPSIGAPENALISEVKYSENVANIFVNIIKSICKQNELIKNLISPEKIEMLANMGIKSLNEKIS